jgi:hypothetical protein
MPIVAAITRASASRFFSQQSPLNPGNTGGNAYTLRRADGTSLGTYRSVAEAQAVFNRYHGPSRVYRWDRQDLAGDIEQHVCIGTPLNAGEIWVLKQPNPQVPNDPGDTSLQQWMEPAYVPNSVKLESVVTGVIDSISDISGADHPLEAVGDPLLVESDPNFKDKLVVDFDNPPGPYGFNVAVSDSLSVPFTVIMVANNLDPGSNGSLWNTSIPPRLTVTNGPGGQWRLVTALGNIDSSVIGSSSSDIIAVKVAPAAVGLGADVSFRVNGIDAGQITNVTDIGGAIEIGGWNTDIWEWRLAFHMIADIADADDTRILQTERYLRETF